VNVRKFVPRSEMRERYAARAVVTLSLVVALPFSGQALAFAAETPAAAPTPASTDTPEQHRALAKAKYEQGVEAYRAERYADAVRLFLEADAISPSAALSYNIARAYEKLSDDAQTLRWYRNYLRLNPRASNAADVQRFVQTLSAALAKKGIQQLTVLSAPAGATVAIDGSPLGVTPLTVELPPGRHSALLSLRGYSDAPADFTLAAASPLDVSVPLHPAAAATATSESRADAPPKRRFGIAPYITLGAAAACLGAAGIFELSRRSAENSAKNEPVQLTFQQDIDDMHSRQTAARILLGVGSALAVTGGALLVFNTPLSQESRAVVAGVPGGATLRFERSF
jgi:tetratricopeptide (TPR) repeat protein